MKTLIIGLFAVLFSSSLCAQEFQSKVFSDDQLGEIETALGDLILHEKEGAFLLVKESETKLFVEFTNDLRGHLLFDVPLNNLSEAQIEKLEALYKEFEIVEPIQNLSEAEMEVVGKTGAFKFLGNDFEKGIEILSRIFSDVFGFEKGIMINLEH